MNKLFFTILLATTTAAFCMNPHERFPDVWQTIRTMQSLEKNEYGSKQHKALLHEARQRVLKHLNEQSSSQDYVLYVLAATLFVDQPKADEYVETAIKLMRSTKENVPFRRPRNDTITLQRATGFEEKRIELKLDLLNLVPLFKANDENEETLLKKLMLTKLIQHVVKRHMFLQSLQEVTA